MGDDCLNGMAVEKKNSSCTTRESIDITSRREAKDCIENELDSSVLRILNRIQLCVKNDECMYICIYICLCVIFAI